MSHSYRDVFQTFSAYRKGSPPVTSDADRSLEFPRRPGSQHRPTSKCQSVSQTTNVRSDKETSSLPLVWVEVRDNVIPPHAVPFALDSHGPLFIARAYLEGAFFLGKAGPQLTSGAIISYGSLEITVTRYDVLVCAGRLSWEIPYSSGTSFMRQDTVITKYRINHGLEQALTYHQDIPENAHNSADNHNKVDNNQRSVTPDPDPTIVASHTRARSNSTYGLSSKESLDVDILKARDTFVPLKSPLELTERSRSLPPRARRSAESSFDARAELGTFRCDSAQSADVTTVITSATHRSEHAPVSRPSVVTSSKPRVRLDCASQGSYRLPTVASAVEYSAYERGTPVGSFAGSEITGFREVVNVDGWSAYSSSPREPPAQSVHAGFAQDVSPRRRYSNTGIAPSTPVNHHTNQFLSTSATSHSLASNVLDSRFTNTPNPSSKDDSQFTPTHYSFSSHQVLSDSPLSQPSTVFSRGTWAGTQGSLALCLCILDDVNDTNKYQSKLANCPVHPPADTIGISANLSDFGHVDQYDQWASPVAKTHVWQRGMQYQKSHLKDSPSHIPQSPTFLSTNSPPAQSSLAGDHTDIDLRSTHYSRHDVPKRPAETSSEDENMTVSEHVCGCESEHVCDSEHWQLVSGTTFGVEAQTCDGTGSDVFTSERPAPITINPSNAGIVTSEVKLLPHPMPLITSASQVAGDSKREHSRAVVQESTLERELVQENRVADPAVSQTIGMGESTSVVPSRGTLVTEECAPLSTVTCSPNSPPSQRPSAQTISCNDGSVTDDELHSLRECADSSVLVCASLAHEENNTSTRVIAAESTQKTSPASNDTRNSSFIQSTLTIVESPSLTSTRHEELYDQDVARDKPSQVTPASKLEEDCKRQTVEDRENHYDQGAESEVKQNPTSYSRTVSVVEGNTSKSAVLNDDRTINEGANGAALSLSINPRSKMSPSEPGVPQDSMINRIESEYEHQSLDLDTVSRNSIHISSHDSTESSEEHIQRQSAPNLSLRNEQFTDDELNRAREEVDSSVLVRSSLIPAENIGTPAPAPHRALDNTRKSSLAYNDLGNSSPTESTSRMGQTSSPVIDLKDGSCGQIVGTELPTHSFSPPNAYVDDRVPVSADYMRQDLEGRGDYHAREVESEVTFKSESHSSAVESVGQLESAMVLNAGGRSDKDANSTISSLPSTYAERKLSSSESGLPQDAGINAIQSAHEYQSSDIDIASATSVQTLAHRAIENRVESSPVTIPEGPCFQYVAIDEPCQHLSTPKIDSTEPSECVHQAVESKGDRHELETESKFNLSLTADSHSVGIVERSTSKTVVSKIHGQMNQNTNVPAFPLSQMTMLSPSDPGIPQDAEADLIQSECEHQSSAGVDAASIDLVQTSNYDCSIQGYRSAQSFSSNEPGATLSTHVYLSLEQNNSNLPPSIDKAVENMQESSSVNGISKSLTSTTYQGHSLVASTHEESCGQDMTKDQLNQGSSSPKYEADEEGVTADRMHQAIIELRCESQSSDVNEVSKTFESEHTWSHHSPANSEWHSQRQGDYHAREVESEVTLKSKSYSSAIESAMVLNAGGRSDEDANSDISSLSSTYTERKLSFSEPGVPQNAGINFIQSGREHQTSEINVASKTFVRTSSYRSIENRDQSSLVTVQEGPWCQPRECFSARKLDINELPDSPKHEADEEGVTADRMHQAIVESRCERRSLDVNEVSKTFESEPTWIHHSLESGEWHTQQQGRQQVHSSGIVGPQVGESNTTPLNITVKNTHTSGTTPDDLRSSPVLEGTSAMEQTPPAGDSLQGAPDRDVTRVRYSSRSLSIPKFEDNNVDASAGYMRQVSVTRGDYHEQRMDSEVEQNLAYHFCSVGMPGQSMSDTVTGNNDRRMDKDAEDTAFPLSSTTIRTKLSIAEPDILRDVATSSKVITTLTNSMQTSSYRSTVNNEHVYQQPARTSSWSNEPPVNQSQTTTPVHLFSVPGENNPTPAQLFSVALSKNTQQPSSAFNSPDSSLPEGVPTTGQTSSPATYECGEPCGRDEARDLPSQGSSTPKLRDDKEDISAHCTFQGIVSNEGNHLAPCAEGTLGAKAGEDHCLKAGPTVTSVTCDSITVQCSSQTKNQENTSCAADTRRCGALWNACDTCSIPSDDCGACTNTAPNDCPPADGQLTQTAAIDCAHECPSTMDSLPVESCCPEPKGPLSYVSCILRLDIVINFVQRALW
ncbi:uncharacterized protein HD556DRAFT_1444594 [Suillus plorans]|uniref:Uncharacterized protein n=1 Tax=Suillus plorans TaxID=116603 RepID=A0A9P7DGZ5_9AGAM|nr:uncharacterized protein HD556DRAFT_1444594 [Suillus plorans]KAG1792332.1 hypothetical protein HD556DRAFT_1444594 [Suillus plorans]